MRNPLSPPPHAASTTQAMLMATLTTDPTSLWQALDPVRQQQLAQYLAELLRRLRRAPLTASPQEVSHEPT